MVYRTAAQTWEIGNGLGNHRVIVNVENPSPYVTACIALRRRDPEPELVGMRIVNMSSGEEVINVSILSISREECSILFQAPDAGKYAVYYMPYIITGPNCYFPVVSYMKPEDMHPETAWLDSYDGSSRQAEVEAVESRTDFDGFYPMEIPMTRKEHEEFISGYKAHPFMLIAENRYNPVMMLGELPEIWKNRENLMQLNDEAAQNEFYSFQVAVYAFQELEDVSVSFHDNSGNPLNSELCTCFNSGGTDWLGRLFTCRLSIKQGEILPLWCGIDVEKANGKNELIVNVHVSAKGYEQIVQINLLIRNEALSNRGDNDIPRLARLRWLNSSMGLDDRYAAGYEPVGVDGLEVSVLGRSVHFGNDGFPHAINSYFLQDCSGVSEKAYPILSDPVSLRISKKSSVLSFSPSGTEILRKGSGSVRIKGRMSCEDICIETDTTMEYDGHMDTFITVTSLNDIDVDDISLIIPYDKSAAAYMVGMGAEGGYRPPNWQYRWQTDRANNCIWLGSPNAGLHVKLKHTQDVWELYTYEETGLPDSWHNQGKGGAWVREKRNSVEFCAYSGPRRLIAGQSIRFRYSLLITPLKSINYKEHWDTRYYHVSTPNLAEDAAREGAHAIILHQGTPLLPYINYPFYSPDKLKEQIDNAHLAGMKFKLYYTIRELSNHAAELPVLRSLKDEILREGPGFRVADHFLPEHQPAMTGGPWLLEHLPEGFVPAWQNPLEDKDYDSALAMTGLSRWHNYYLEGLYWLIKELGMDGLYLDGIGYDRQIMKRVRKVLDDAKPGCLMDFHSGNNYDPVYGLSSPICSYMELMPSVDSLWLGEGYDYEAKSADYWLVEVSGIPFGLMGEMLQNGGNKWRGMLFGMTCRRYGNSDPTPLWRFWDEYHLEDTEMIGFWNPECPVSTSSSAVKATAYVSEKYVIIAVASWENRPMDLTGMGWSSSCGISISIDIKVLGLSEDYTMICPAIKDFQEACTYKVGDFVKIEPAKGKIFIIRRQPDLE